MSAGQADLFGMGDENDPEDIQEAARTWGKLPPFVKGSETSREAAASMVDRAPSLRVAVLVFLVARGEYGATDDEIEEALQLRHQTASARRRELVKADLVEDSGRRRKTRSGRGATVWIASPRARVRVPLGPGGPRTSMEPE